MNKEATCKGSYFLGTACGNCSRCTEEIKRAGSQTAAQLGLNDVAMGETAKWLGREADFNHALAGIRLSEREYSKAIFDIRDDVTRRQAQDEFWIRVAEAEGFTIKFNREG